MRNSKENFSGTVSLEHSVERESTLDCHIPSVKCEISNQSHNNLVKLFEKLDHVDLAEHEPSSHTASEDEQSTPELFKGSLSNFSEPDRFHEQAQSLQRDRGQDKKLRDEGQKLLGSPNVSGTFSTKNSFYNLAAKKTI